MASNGRETRRRKILERGSDRLAFITGQINGVPPPPLPPSDSTSSISQSDIQVDESLPNLIPPRVQILNDQETASTGQQQEDSSNAVVLESVEHIIHRNRAKSLQAQNTETLPEALPSSDPRDTTTAQPSPATAGPQTPSVVDLDASQAFLPLANFVNTITPKHIGTAIAASEYARMFSAFVIALLVILSHRGFSSLGNIVSFRPVFLLILTDITIVLGNVLLSHLGDSNSTSATVMNGQGIVDQVGNALETVFMVKKIMDAFLMDFSFYTVILICGLLFKQNIFT